jgi:hypothetical protein
MLDEAEIDALGRQLSLDKGREIVSVSAIRPATLRPFVAKTAEVIGKFIGSGMQFAAQAE